MNWRNWEKPTNTSQLISNLLQFPINWALTPLQGKQPKRVGWTEEPPLSRDVISSLIADGEIATSRRTGKTYRRFWSGYGLRTGEPSGGLLAIDIDGHSAAILLQQISGGDLPQTVSWTSGKTGRRQLLYQIPSEYRETLISFSRRPLRQWGGFAADCDLDFRYNGSQSVLPPSYHPETGSYRWINSPTDVGVADAPIWLCELVCSLANQEQYEVVSKKESEERRAREREERRQQRLLNSFVGDGNLEDILEQSLSRLTAEDIFNWGGHNFKYRGGELAGCCPQHQSASGSSFVVGVDKCEWYCFGCAVGGGAVQYRWFVKGGKGSPTGKDFVDIVRELAGDAGVAFPEKKLISMENGRRGWAKLTATLRKLIGLQQAIPSGFVSSVPPVEVSSVEQLPPQSIFFEAGGRFRAIQTALEQGARIILEQSGTGSGKSYDAGLLRPEDVGTSRVVYVSNDHRNPSTPTLASWDDLESRHGGLVRDELGNIRRRQNGTDGGIVEIAPNCARTETINVLRAKLISQADASALVCKTCPHFDACRTGNQYGYLAQRSRILKDSRNFRAHPASLPNAGESLTTDGRGKTFPYAKSEDDENEKGTFLIWEEGSQTLKYKEILVANQFDIRDALAALSWNVEILERLYPALAKLKAMLSGDEKSPRFGWGHNEIIKELGVFPADIDIDAIIDCLDEDNKVSRILDPFQGQYEVSLEDLPSSIKKYLTEKDAELATRANSIIKQRWLSTLLKIWKGEKLGYLSLAKGDLSISILDPRLREIIASAQGNLILDATATREEIALQIGVDPEEIWVIKQEEPAEQADIEFFQVVELGRMGGGRGERQKQRASVIIDALKEQQPDTAVIRFKKDARDGDLAWWRDSRGSNDAEQSHCLILDGVPTSNLASLAADFTLLYQRIPTGETEVVTRSLESLNSMPPGVTPFFKGVESVDDEFREFIRKDILATIHQGIGRLRANRRAGEQLRCYFLGDFALGFPVQVIRAVDVCAAAGTVQQRFLIDCKAAIEAGAHTLSEVAHAVGRAKSTVSENLRRWFGMGWAEFSEQICSVLLEDTLYSKSEKEFTPDADLQEAESFMAHNIFPLAEPWELIPTIAQIFHSWGELSWLRIASLVSPTVKSQLIAQLVSEMPQAARQMIVAIPL